MSRERKKIGDKKRGDLRNIYLWHEIKFRAVVNVHFFKKHKVAGAELFTTFFWHERRRCSLYMFANTILALALVLQSEHDFM